MPGTTIETAELEPFLSATLDTAIVDIEVLHDGLNLSVAISTEDENVYVLRRPNKLRHTSLFNDLRRECRVLRRLEDTAIPAPRPVLFCDDESVIGDSFLLTTHLDGTAVRLGADLPERFQDAHSRSRAAGRLVDTLADIHSLDVERFADVCERQTPREEVARTTERLDEATAVTGHELPTLWIVAEWLRENVPSASATTLVHGDYRPSNVLFAGTERPEISGVLDWETAFLGDPLTELGYLLLRWRDEGDPTPPLDGLEARYPNEDGLEELREANRRGLSPFTAKPGSPSRRELVARYESETGIAFEHERFYRAHAAFGLATVWEDLHRHRMETEDGPSETPLWVEYVSLIAESIISGGFER